MTTQRDRSLRALSSASMLVVVLAVTWLGPSASAQVGDPTAAVTDTVGGTTDTVTDTVDGTTGTVTDTVGDTTDTVTDTVDETADSVGDATGGTTDPVTDTVGDTTDTVGGAVEDTTGTITDTVDGGGDSPATGTSSTDGTSGRDGADSGDGSGGAGGAGTVITLPDGTKIVVPKGSVNGQKVFDLNPEAAAALRALVDGFAGAVPPGSPIASSTGDAADQESLSFIENASRIATQVGKALAFPVALAALVIGFLILQGRLGRKDPKLVAAPVHAEESSLSFR